VPGPPVRVSPVGGSRLWCKVSGLALAWSYELEDNHSMPIPALIPCVAPDHEWLKNVAAVMVGLVVGLAVGVISALYVEPLKARRMKKLDAELAEESIYDELGQMIAGFRTALLMEEKYCPSGAETPI